MTVRVQDHKGDEIKVGSKVLYGCPDETEQQADYVAEVVAISDPDVVYNPDTDTDDGGYNVILTIKFASGEIEMVKADFNTMASRDSYEVDGVVEEVFEEGGDLEVINP